jgi:hypothetical protein
MNDPFFVNALMKREVDELIVELGSKDHRSSGLPRKKILVVTDAEDKDEMQRRKKHIQDMNDKHRSEQNAKLEKLRNRSLDFSRQ